MTIAVKSKMDNLLRIYPNNRCSNRKGQVYEYSDTGFAFIFLAFVMIVMYAIYAVSGTGNVDLKPSTATITGAPADIFIAPTMSALLRTPLPDGLDKTATKPDGSMLRSETTARYLSENPEIWKGRTYHEFLTLLVSTTYHDRNRLRSVFKEITLSTFADLPPRRKRFILDYDASDPSASESIDTGFVQVTLPERTIAMAIPTLTGAPSRIRLFVPEQQPAGAEGDDQ